MSAFSRLRSTWGTARLLTRRDESVNLARQVRAGRLTYLDLPALVDLWDSVAEAEASERGGMIIEAGTALGGSAIMLAGARRQSNRQIVLYDTFGMIPPPGEQDGAAVHERYEKIIGGASAGIGADTYYGYQGDLRNTVVESLRHHGADTSTIELVQGLYESTLHPTSVIAVAHIDCDWYASVSICLERVWPFMAEGGVVVVDDYDHWDGCRRAVDEFIAGHDDLDVERRARIQLRKR